MVDSGPQHDPPTVVAGREWRVVAAGRHGQVVVAGRPKQLALYDRSVEQADRRMVEAVAQCSLWRRLHGQFPVQHPAQSAA